MRLSQIGLKIKESVSSKTIEETLLILLLSLLSKSW